MYHGITQVGSLRNQFCKPTEEKLSKIDENSKIEIIGMKSVPKGFWRGWQIKARGYKSIYFPNHPSHKGTKNIYILEHRLIMEAYLGKWLKSNEFIHHINGIRDDNYLKNLRLMSNEEHSKLHNLSGEKHFNWTTGSSRGQALKNYQKQYRKDNLYKRREYIKNNREKINAQKREYYQKYKGIINQKNKEYQLKNKEKVREMNREYHRKNKDELNRKKRENLENKKKGNARRVELRKNDPVYREKINRQKRYSYHKSKGMLVGWNIGSNVDGNLCLMRGGS